MRIPLRVNRAQSWLARRAVLCAIDKLTDFRPLLFQILQVLLTNPLINLELLLRQRFLAGTNVGLPQTIVGVGKIGVQLEGPHILWNGLGILTLVGVKIAQLQVRLGKLGIKIERILKQSLNLTEVKAGILRPLSFPQTHRVVVEGLGIARLEFRESAESLYAVVGLARRTVIGPGQKKITARVRRVQISRAE